MNKLGIRISYIITFLVLGSSYVSAYAFGAMHKVHHAHSDTDMDPHTPRKTRGYFNTILQARNFYFSIFVGKKEIPPAFKKGLPEWHSFDRFAHNWITRAFWVVIYIWIYSILVDSWWQYAFLPITIAMGALQAGVVNWWAHKYGYRNFDTPDDSRNIIPFDFAFFGESYHNNHHKYPWRINHGSKWYEVDMGYYFLLLLKNLGLVKFKKRSLD